MKIELTLDDEAVSEFAAALASAMSKAAPKTGGKGKGKPAAAEPEDTGEEATAEAETTEATAEAEDFGETESGGPTREDVLAKLKAVSGNAKLGQDKAMEILKKSGGVSKLSSLDEGKFAAVIKACDAAISKAK